MAGLPGVQRSFEKAEVALLDRLDCPRDQT